MEILDTELSKKMEHEIFQLSIKQKVRTNPNTQNVTEHYVSTWENAADQHHIIFGNDEDPEDEDSVEQVVKDVGAISFRNEVNEKIRSYMERSGMKSWEWTGHWKTEGGTLYAKFQRRINQ